MRTALQQLQQDGVASTGITHIYLKCDGLDFDFTYNPAGVHAKTVNDLMHGNALEHVLERFASMIQSGKDIFLDNRTVLTIFTFSPNVIIAGAKQMNVSRTKSEFIERNKSIVEIKNYEDQTCFSCCLVFFWL